MTDPRTAAAYIAMLRARFGAYRRDRFAGADHLFLPYSEGGPVVFRPEHAAANLLVPPSAEPRQREAIIGMLPPRQRHLHFGSMQSSQALAQSVFGAVAAFGLLPALEGVEAECGRPAFGKDLSRASIRLEVPVRTLGEPRPTSLDAWIDGPRVAVECKLSEAEFGTCSRPRLAPGDPAFEAQHCDGTHTRQRGREARCALTAIGVRYWAHMEALFGWSAEADHSPCPLAPAYQLARSVLAARVGEDGGLRPHGGHALVLFDRRNPAMAPGGKSDRQWRAAVGALRVAGALRRLSWQGFLAQWPRGGALGWLKAEIGEKYGIA